MLPSMICHHEVFLGQPWWHFMVWLLHVRRELVPGNFGGHNNYFASAFFREVWQGIEKLWHQLFVDCGWVPPHSFEAEYCGILIPFFCEESSFIVRHINEILAFHDMGRAGTLRRVIAARCCFVDWVEQLWTGNLFKPYPVVDVAINCLDLIIDTSMFSLNFRDEFQWRKVAKFPIMSTI